MIDISCMPGWTQTIGRQVYNMPGLQDSIFAMGQTYQGMGYSITKKFK